jgi:hypothetical protein
MIFGNSETPHDVFQTKLWRGLHSWPLPLQWLRRLRKWIGHHDAST